MAKTIPELLTVAIPVAPLFQEPPASPVEERAVVAPGHTDKVPTTLPASGNGSTVMR